MQRFFKFDGRLRWAGRRKLNLSDPEHLLEEVELRDRELIEAQRTIKALNADMADRDAELEALKRISEATGSVFGSEEMLQGIAEIAIRITGTEGCQIYLFSEDRTKLILRATGEAGRELVGKIVLDIGEGITGWVAREKKHVACPRQAYKDHRFKFFPVLDEAEYESFLSVPLLVRNEVIGVINVRTREAHEYTRNQVRLLSGIASQVAGAIDHMRRYKKLEAQASQLSTLSEVSKTITSNMYLEEILQLLVNLTAHSLNYKICTVLLLDDNKQELVIKATQAKSKAYLTKPNLNIGQSVAGRAVKENQVIIISDVRECEEYRYADIAAEEGLASLACVPLKVKNNVLGVLNCYTEKPRKFPSEEIATLEALANQAAIAIEHAKLMVRSAILQEMHHRLKNNLQQIASLLRLQLHYSKYNSVEEAVNDSLGRISAMAAVHELLSRDDLDLVSVKKVAASILHHTQQGFIPPGKTIRTSVSGEDVMLPLKEATSVALVLNELIQNAVKHGFASIDNGEVSVYVETTDGLLEITVQNDGAPLPDDFSADTSQNMGLRIVDTLVRDSLNGRFTLENKDRITATVAFPRPM
jgi:two-component sensor histidine kinase